MFPSVICSIVCMYQSERLVEKGVKENDKED